MCLILNVSIRMYVLHIIFLIIWLIIYIFIIKIVFNFKCIYTYACVTYYFFLLIIWLIISIFIINILFNVSMYLHELHASNTNFLTKPNFDNWVIEYLLANLELMKVIALIVTIVTNNSAHFFEWPNANNCSEDCNLANGSKINGS